jgi:hypothetical protein
MTMNPTEVQANQSNSISPKPSVHVRDDEQQGLKVFVEVSENDVLLGKQRDAFNHIGNRRFRSLINANWERYNSSKGRCERTTIVVSIVNFLREERKVRFLKRDKATGRWYVVPDCIAREKVGHAIRDAINFRRHHDRKMAEASGKAIKKEPCKYNNFIEGGSRPCPAPKKKTLATPAPVYPLTAKATPSPPNSIKKRKMKVKHTVKRIQENSVPNLIQEAEPSREDVAELLGALRKTGSSESPSPLEMTPMTLPPTLSMPPPPTLPTRVTPVFTEREQPPVRIEEAAMMGAFNVWASQSYVSC